MPLMSNVEAQMKYMLLIYLDELAGGFWKKLERGLTFNCRGLQTGCIQALFELERG